MLALLENAKRWYNKVFKYPKVEYIPIAFHSLIQVPTNSPVTRVNVYPSASKISSPSVSPYPSNRPGLYLTLSNNKVVKIRFRGGVCTVVVDPSPGQMEVIWLNAQYFPKGTIHFSVLAKDGRRITWTNFHY